MQASANRECPAISACRNKAGKQQVQLTLTGKEASDYLNFVVKDTSSGTWYDQGGTNFHIPLTGSVATMSIDEQIPDAELPDLPGELCGIWSYIKWEHAGCPNRNEQQNQQAYQEAIAVSLLKSTVVYPHHITLCSGAVHNTSCTCWHCHQSISALLPVRYIVLVIQHSTTPSLPTQKHSILVSHFKYHVACRPEFFAAALRWLTYTFCTQELKEFQRDGHSLNDLWKVAKGETKYQDFAKSSIPAQGKQPQPLQEVPGELVCCA